VSGYVERINRLDPVHKNLVVVFAKLPIGVFEQERLVTLTADPPPDRILHAAAEVFGLALGPFQYLDNTPLNPIFVEAQHRSLDVIAAVPYPVKEEPVRMPAAARCRAGLEQPVFLLDCLELILCKSSLEDIVARDDESMLSALEDMTRLYYGLYLQVCDDIGMKPEFLPEEMSDTQMLQAKQQTEQWLMAYETESFCEKDVRYIVPALTNLSGTQVRYWMVLGVKLLKIKADYVKRPHVQILDVETEEVVQQIPTDTEIGRITDTHLQYKFSPEEYFLPVEIFAEATGSAEPLTREEFHKLCDRYKSRKKIIAAIESRATLTISKPVIVFVTASILMVASIALVCLLKNKRSASA